MDCNVVVCGSNVATRRMSKIRGNCYRYPELTYLDL